MISENHEQRSQVQADLDLFNETSSGLVLTDAELLRIHGGSCVATYGPGTPTVNGDNGQVDPRVRDVLGPMLEPVPEPPPFQRSK